MLLDKNSVIFNSILNLIFPSSCPVCNLPSNNYATVPICKECWSEIRSYKGNSCSICSKILGLEDISICAECYRERPFFKKVLFFGLYDGVLKEAIHLYKFSGFKRLSRPISNLLSNMEIPDADLIVPVPLTKRRLKERGFNQSYLLARHLSRIFKVKSMNNLLVKTKETAPQSTLTKKERLRSLKHAFKSTERIDNKRVIILDDVFTTGTTLNECARVLLNSGAEEVYCLVVARARI